MADGWKIGVLEDLAEVIMGYSPPGKTCNTLGTGTPLLNGPTEFESHHPKPVQFTTQPRRLAESGDLLFCVRGSTTGRMNWADQTYAIGRGIAAIRPKTGPAFGPFVRGLVEVALPVLLSSATGSTFPSVSGDQIREIVCPLPPQSDQKAIASVLGALDDKIELNRRMNETLESMARALFQSWFVDFDPVRAKLDGRPPTGLDPTTAALFPDSFQDSPLGPIPKDWRACKLGDIARNVSITFDFKSTPEVIFINTGDVLEGDFLHSKRSAQAGLPGQAKKSIQPDDILFSEIRPVNKRFAYVDFDSSDYVVSTKFMIIRGSEEVQPRLLYRILTAKETIDEFQLQAESRSGTFPQITFDSVSYLPIVLPPIEIQQAFQLAVGKMDAQIKVNKQQSSTLAILRDTLLPKLLSGKIVIEKV